MSIRYAKRANKNQFNIIILLRDLYHWLNNARLRANFSILQETMSTTTYNKVSNGRILCSLPVTRYCVGILKT